MGPTHVFLSILTQGFTTKKRVNDKFDCSMMGLGDVRVTWKLHIAMDSTGLSYMVVSWKPKPEARHTWALYFIVYIIAC